MKLNHETVDNIAKVSLIGGTSGGVPVGGMTAMGWIAERGVAFSTIFAGIMVAVAITGLVVTWYFKREESTRQKEMHALKKDAILKGIPIDG